MARNRSRAARRIEARTKANAESRLAMQSRAISEEPNPLPQVARIRQSPLERYRAHGVITEDRYKAGIDFAYDFERARVIGPSPVKASAWEVRTPSSSAELTELEAGRYERYRRAVQKLGKHLSPLIEAVCAYGETCEEWASRQPEMTRQDATALLRHGLLVLAEHYGYRRPPRRHDGFAL